MKKYSYFCEDEALQVFIDKTLQLLGPFTRCKEFKRVQNQLGLPNGRDVGMIKRNFPDAVKLAFYSSSDADRIDLFIVSYDFDSLDLTSYDLHITQQKEKIHSKSRGKCVFCIPVQCIEYWLWYIKHSEDENQPSPNSIENDKTKTRKDIKEDVYGNASSVGKQLMESKPLLDRLNIERLEYFSPSFKKFTDQIREFCSRG